MPKVMVAGVGMTRFGRWLDRTLGDLAHEAVSIALLDAGVESRQLQAAVVSNAAGHLTTGMAAARGQMILEDSGLLGLPVYNVENGCAGGSTAFNVAWMSVAAGRYDVVLALGVEKVYHPDKKAMIQAFSSGAHPEDTARLSQLQRQNEGHPRTIFMDYYAELGRQHMASHGTRKEHFARIAVKNHHNGARNPHAQFQHPGTLAEVLASPLLVEPLHVQMCAPFGDGAAAVILCSEEYARRLVVRRPVWVAATEHVSGGNRVLGEHQESVRAAQLAYHAAGLGPEEIDVAEVHDATTIAELLAYEQLGFCAHGEGGCLVEEGATAIGGRLPVNTSGGLSAKGHPIGATGLAMVAELTWQLRGEAGVRQVEQARVALSHNAGGLIHGDNATAFVTILQV